MKPWRMVVNNVEVQVDNVAVSVNVVALSDAAGKETRSWGQLRVLSFDGKSGESLMHELAFIFAKFVADRPPKAADTTTCSPGECARYRPPGRDSEACGNFCP